MALVRRLEIPLGRLRIILRRAIPGKLHAEAELRLRIAVASPGFGGFPSRLLRAAEQSAKEQFVHAHDISRREPKHKPIQIPRAAFLSDIPDPTGSNGRMTTELQPAIRVVMMPKDTNPMGTIFGGLILSYIDQAGAVEFRKHSDKKLVTVAMHEVKFLAPVLVGDLVSFYTETVKIGNTSLTARITVEAKRGQAPHETVRVTQAEVVYVAVDDRGNPVPVR